MDGFPQPLPSALEFGVVIFAQYALLYFAAAGTMALVVAWVRRRAPDRVFSARRRGRGQVRREILLSLRSMAVFTGLQAIGYYGSAYGPFKLYFDVDRFGWTYWAVSLVGLVVLHDAYFYWTHRAMHHPAIFPWMHRKHHLSTAPTPWTAYAFDFAEAVVQGLYVLAVLLVAPLHVSVISLFMLHQIVRNVMIHAGVEVMPRRWPLIGWLAPSLHHELHHEDFRGNYGLYFTWWDTWCGTENRRYQPSLGTQGRV